LVEILEPPHNAAISRFFARVPDYAPNTPPIRGGRVRFRGFLSVSCEVGG
jgi:hypothetical protein